MPDAGGFELAQVPPRPSILVAAYRPFDVRLFVNSGVAEAVSRSADLTILAPETLVEALRELVPDAIHVESLRDTDSASWLKRWTHNFTEQIARLTYPEKNGHQCTTGVLHRRTFRRKILAKSFLSRGGACMVLLLALLCNHVRPARMGLRAAFGWSANRRVYTDLLRDADLLVVHSAGSLHDGFLMAEAMVEGVDRCVLVQSWDRTATQGYGLGNPTDVLVWSDIMCREAEVYWDMPIDRLHTVGAPNFDAFFQLQGIQGRDEFFRQYGFDPEEKTIYVSMGGPAWHEGNLELVDLLLALRSDGRLRGTPNLLLRPHPYYFKRDDRARHEALRAHLARLKNLKGVFVDYPGGKQTSEEFLLDKRDADKLASIFTHSDVAITVSSTQMIEACIFDTPVIDLCYGRWKSDSLNVRLEEYSLEHLVRIRATGAVHTIYVKNDLEAAINTALDRPNLRRIERNALVDQEIPAYRGTSGEEISRVLADLARKSTKYTSHLSPA